MLPYRSTTQPKGASTDAVPGPPAELSFRHWHRVGRPLAAKSVRLILSVATPAMDWLNAKTHPVVVVLSRRLGARVTDTGLNELRIAIGGSS